MKMMKSIHLLAAITAILFLAMCDKDPPKASFTYSSESYEAGDTIFFHNTSTNANSYEWNFGDDKTSTEKIHGTFSIVQEIILSPSYLRMKMAPMKQNNLLS